MSSQTSTDSEAVRKARAAMARKRLVELYRAWVAAGRPRR